MVVLPVVFKGGIAVIHAAVFAGVMSTTSYAAPMSDRIECWYGAPKPVVWAGIAQGQIIRIDVGVTSKNGDIICIGPKALKYPVTLLVQR